MLLTFDIGNTTIKTGTFDNGKLFNRFRLKKMEDLLTLLENDEYLFAAYSSVVPEKSDIINCSNFDKPVYQITSKSKFNIDFSNYSMDSLGVDRICSLEGALSRFKEKSNSEFDYLITIDCGTATTMNVVKYPNIFLGGLIAPGVTTMFKSLQKNTSQLPMITPDDFKHLIGTNTNESIASGVITATVGMITKVLMSLNPRKKKRMEVYVTGGNAIKILDHLHFKHFYEEYLVLYGIKELFYLNAKEQVVD